MTTIEEYVQEIQEADNANYKSNYPNLPLPVYSMTIGKRFYKIIRNYIGQTSVHCFVDIATGDIYKAATYNTPAKGVRGNLKNDKKPLLGYDFYRR
jgi:hypothetical protein